MINTPDDVAKPNDGIVGNVSQNDSGRIPGVPPSAPPSGSGMGESGDTLRQPTGWHTYHNSSFGFSIEYPDIFVRIELTDYSTHTSMATHRIHFQDTILAQSETTNLQPPQFAIDVFDPPDDVSFEQWIDNDVTFSGSTRDSVDIGRHQGYVVTLSIQLAPNQFYYVAGDNYYYRLTPLGLYADRMLQSFTMDI